LKCQRLINNTQALLAPITQTQSTAKLHTQTLRELCPEQTAGKTFTPACNPSFPFGNLSGRKIARAVPYNFEKSI